jgi:hypothetical protein
MARKKGGHGKKKKEKEKKIEKKERKKWGIGYISKLRWWIFKFH